MPANNAPSGFTPWALLAVGAWPGFTVLFGWRVPLCAPNRLFKLVCEGTAEVCCTAAFCLAMFLRASRIAEVSCWEDDVDAAVTGLVG